MWFLIYKNENDKGGPHSYQVIWFAFANITGEVAPSKTLYTLYFRRGSRNAWPPIQFQRMNSLLIVQTGRNIPVVVAKSISNYESVVNEVSLASFYLPQKYMHTPQCPLNVPVESACSIKQNSTIDAGAFGKH